MDELKKKYGYTRDEILAHYGYAPEVARSCGVGIWEREEAFRQLDALPDFAQLVDRGKKAKITFHYDPDYPAALLITDAKLNV